MIEGWGDSVRASEENLMDHMGADVQLQRAEGGEPIDVRARFWVRSESDVGRELPHGGRGVRQQRWGAVLADETALDGAALVPGDAFIRPSGPRLKVLAGGKTVEAADGRALAYHVPVAEVR